MSVYISIDFGVGGSVDTGTRPYQGTQPIWLNNSIFLAGGISKSETQIGRPTTVKVRVSNTDQANAVEDARVDAYVMNPHVGLSTPSQAKRRLRSKLATIPAGAGADVDTDPHVLECFIQGANGPEPWIPTADDMAGSDHLCVIANCYADRDGAPQPDGQAFDIVNNPHHGQRNIQVLAAPMFAGGITMFFVMPPPKHHHAILEVVPVPEAAINDADRGMLASHPALKLVDGQLVVPGPGGEQHPMHFAERPLDARLIVKGAKDGPKVELPQMAHPIRVKLALGTKFGDDPGALNAVEIVQRDKDGRALGSGLRVLAVVTAKNDGRR